MMTRARSLMPIALAILSLAVACSRARTQEAAAHSPADQELLSAHVGTVLADAPPVSETVEKSEAEWRAQLSVEQFHILRESGTERAYTGALWDHHGVGTYHCAACGNPLFSSATKFDSRTGWPSYYEPIQNGRIDELQDTTHGMVRTEVRCARCQGHLGHLFPDGPPPTGQRYCINSASLEFRAAE